MYSTFRIIYAMLLGIILLGENFHFDEALIRAKSPA